MKDRIITLIKAKNLTAAQFADEIGVQKSSISHIISGRNNASLDFIQKVLLRYPDVSMEWLMFGKGPLSEGVETALNTNSDRLFNASQPKILPTVDLFSEMIPGKSADFRKEIDLSPEQNSDGNTSNENMEVKALPSEKEIKSQVTVQPEIKAEYSGETSGHKDTITKTILKIVEFYSDNTYKEYFPEN